MAPKIHYISFAQDKTIPSKEDDAAKKLKERFEKDLKQYKNAKGDIYILTSIRIFGQKRDDIDILVIGLLENFTIRRVNTKNYGNVDELRICSFIANIELKTHHAPDVKHVGADYIVKYPDRKENASQQCREAKFSLIDHLKDQLGIKPFLCDVLWLRGLNQYDINLMRGDMLDNALPRTFSFKDFVSVLLRQTKVLESNGNYILDSFKGEEKDYRRMVELFTRVRVPKGLTKNKFELLSQKSSDIDKLLKDVGSKLTIVTGRAGTGKTIQLLQLAFRLVDERSSRCLLLTYNHALLSDIKHLIDYVPIPTKADGRTLSIKTIDSFFQSLMLETGVINESLSPYCNDYNEQYLSKLNDLYKYIIDICTKEDIETLKDIAEQYIDWDYILVDEAQDFKDIEKYILFKVYGPHRLIVADGVDQFMRDSVPQHWDKGLDKDKLWKPSEMDLGRRQKAHLVEFVNAFAKLAKIDWKVRPNDDLTGGVIRIYPNFRKSYYDDLKKNCEKNGCENYDILILQPPQRVKYDDNGDKHFELIDNYESKGIPIYDGINNKLRTSYPTKDQCRLYQYDSCRGLEGWCVVCAEFDNLIKYKMDNYIPDENSLGFNQETIKKRFVYLWALMPLTRAVDTLIITLKDPNTEIGKMLKQLSETYDFVKWYINN